MNETIFVVGPGSISIAATKVQPTDSFKTRQVIAAAAGAHLDPGSLTCRFDCLPVVGLICQMVGPTPWEPCQLFGPLDLNIKVILPYAGLTADEIDMLIVHFDFDPDCVENPEDSIGLEFDVKASIMADLFAADRQPEDHFFTVSTLKVLASFIDKYKCDHKITYGGMPRTLYWLTELVLELEPEDEP